MLLVVPSYKDKQVNKTKYISTLMRIERSDVSSIARDQAKTIIFKTIKTIIKRYQGLITGYARNVASFNSHQSAYIFVLFTCL